MTHTRVPSAAERRYGFKIYKNGELVREQIVVACCSAIAEVTVWRYLAPDEYVWYAEPRLIADAEPLVDLIEVETDENDEPEAEEAA